MNKFYSIFIVTLLCMTFVSCSSDDDSSSSNGSPVAGQWTSVSGWGDGTIVFNADHTGTVVGKIGPNTRFPEGNFTYRIEVDGRNQYGSEGFIYATYTSVSEGTAGFVKTWEFEYLDESTLFLEGTKVQRSK